MASQGRIPSSHNHSHHLPGPGPMHHDPYHSLIRLPPGGFPPFEMFPPPEVMEQKLSAQHVEISKLAKENQRLAVSHETLRQDIGTVNKELQLVHSHVAEMKSEKEQQKIGVMDKISKMEVELKAAEKVQMELQKSHAEAQSLVSTRQEQISNMQRLTCDLQMAHGDAQQIPVLMSELDCLRQEYHHARGTYEYEKKLYNEHLESLQLMEKNCMEMSREVVKLRAELTNFSNFDPRTGGQYSGYSGYGDSYPMGNYASGQKAYPFAQGQAPLHGGGTASRAAGTVTGGPAGVGGNSPHIAGQSAPNGSGAPLDASKAPGPSVTTGTGYDSLKGRTGASYDGQRIQNGCNYNAQIIEVGTGYDPSQRGPTGPGYGALSFPSAHGLVYGGQVAPNYDTQRGLGYDVQGGGSHDMQKGAHYDPSFNTGYVGPQGQVPAKNMTYASAAPSTGSGNPPPIK